MAHALSSEWSCRSTALHVVVYNGHRDSSAPGRDRIGTIARQRGTNLTAHSPDHSRRARGPFARSRTLQGLRSCARETGNDCLQLRSPKRKSSPESDQSDDRPSKEAKTAGNPRARGTDPAEYAPVRLAEPGRGLAGVPLETLISRTPLEDISMVGPNLAPAPDEQLDAAASSSMALLTTANQAENKPMAQWQTSRSS
jgi:hypothetical protein